MMRMNKIALSVLAVCVGFSAGTLASGKYDDSDDSSSYSSKKDDDSYSKSDSDSYTSSYQSNSGGGHSSGGYSNDGGYSNGDGYSNSGDSGDDKDDGDDTKKRLALNLVGTGEKYTTTVPPLEKYGPPLDAECFDVELKNIHDGEHIGWATDCLSEIIGDPGVGLQLVGTTFFYLPDGLIVTRGDTTVRPVLTTIVTPEGKSISHITGASSDENAVIKASGEYQWHKGTARLSGMVDLSNFDGSEGSPIFFDCLFIIELEEYQPKFNSWYDRYRYRYEHNSYYEEHQSDNYYGKHDDSGHDDNDYSYNSYGSDDSYEKSDKDNSYNNGHQYGKDRYDNSSGRGNKSY
ncbi:hypothetical protein [Photobacterium sp. DNB22_13_2]